MHTIYPANMINFFQKRYKALSLIEVSISLVIIGLLATGALKGWKWVENTKISSTVNQILQIQTSSESYKSTYQKQPNVEIFWKELEPYGGIKSNNEKALSTLGAIFTKTEETIELAPLTAIQALQIKNLLDQNDDLGIGWIKIAKNQSAQQPLMEIDKTDKRKNYKIIIDI